MGLTIYEIKWRISAIIKRRNLHIAIQYKMHGFEVTEDAVENNGSVLTEEKRKQLDAAMENAIKRKEQEFAARNIQWHKN